MPGQASSPSLSGNPTSYKGTFISRNPTNEAVSRSDDEEDEGFDDDFAFSVPYRNKLHESDGDDAAYPRHQQSRFHDLYASSSHSGLSADSDEDIEIEAPTAGLPLSSPSPSSSSQPQQHPLQHQHQHPRTPTQTQTHDADVSHDDAAANGDDGALGNEEDDSMMSQLVRTRSHSRLFAPISEDEFEHDPDPQHNASASNNPNNRNSNGSPYNTAFPPLVPAPNATDDTTSTRSVSHEAVNDDDDDEDLVGEPLGFSSFFGPSRWTGREQRNIYGNDDNQDDDSSGEEGEEDDEGLVQIMVRSRRSSAASGASTTSATSANSGKTRDSERDG